MIKYGKICFQPSKQKSNGVQVAFLSALIHGLNVKSVLKSLLITLLMKLYETKRPNKLKKNIINIFPT